jgi:hypothetical protein
MNPTTGEIIWQQYAAGVDPQLVAALNRSVQPYPRDRFPAAAAMLEALQAPSTPSYQPTLAVSPAARGVGEQVNPPASVNYTPATQQPRGGKNVVLGSAIVGGLVGVSIVAGFVLSRNLQPSPTATSTPILTGENPTDSPTTDIATTPIANTPAASPSPTPSIAPLPSPSRPTPPRLSQVIPSYIPNSFSPENAFTACPQSTQLYLVGETANFNFAVCGANENPQYYVGKHKGTGNGITVPWNGSEFRNGNIVYSPPDYEGTDYEGLELTVDQGDKQLVAEDVIRLYKLEE